MKVEQGNGDPVQKRDSLFIQYTLDIVPSDFHEDRPNVRIINLRGQGRPVIVPEFAPSQGSSLGQESRYRRRHELVLFVYNISHLISLKLLDRRLSSLSLFMSTAIAGSSSPEKNAQQAALVR